MSSPESHVSGSLVKQDTQPASRVRRDGTTQGITIAAQPTSEFAVRNREIISVNFTW